MMVPVTIKVMMARLTKRRFFFWRDMIRILYQFLLKNEASEEEGEKIVEVYMVERNCC